MYGWPYVALLPVTDALSTVLLSTYQTRLVCAHPACTVAQVLTVSYLRYMLEQSKYRLSASLSLAKVIVMNSLTFSFSLYNISLPMLTACNIFPCLYGCPLLGDSKTVYCDHVHVLSNAVPTAHTAIFPLGSGAGSVPHPTPPIFVSETPGVPLGSHNDTEARDSGRRLNHHVVKDPSLSQRMFLAPNSHTLQFSWYIICLIMWPSTVLLFAVFACMMPSNQHATPPPFNSDDRSQSFRM